MTYSPDQRTPSDQRPILILQVGAEGGSFTVYGRGDAQGAQEFQVVLSEAALDEPTTASRWLTDWEAVLAHIGRWPWPNLFPMVVHPDWRDRVMQAVRKFRDAHGEPVRPTALCRWQAVCGDDDHGDRSGSCGAG